MFAPTTRANSAYINIWFIIFGYAGLVLVDLGLKAMGWQGATIFMLFVFIFLAFFVLMQPAVLCAVFLISAVDEWSVRGGWNAGKVWITKQVPATVYLVMIIPLTITFLPVEKYLGIAAVGLIIYWMIEVASIRTDANRGLIVLRAIYWCIFGYLAIAGLYGTHFGQKIINESPAAQKLLAINNPFETSKVQAEYDAAMADVKIARENALEKCFSSGIAEAKKNSTLTDQSNLDRIKRECDIKSGYVKAYAPPPAIVAPVIPAQEHKRVETSAPREVWPETKPPAQAPAIALVDPATTRAQEREAKEKVREEERRLKSENIARFNSAKREFVRLERNVLYCETQSCATSQVDDLVLAAEAYSESSLHVDLWGDVESSRRAGEHTRKNKAEYVVLAALREQYRNERDSVVQRELRANINDLMSKLRR